MQTKIFKKEDIIKAAEIIKTGGIVAFPTETVYGLGANALNSDAVKKIFKAKGRPADNPLIVHISDTNQLKKLTSEIPAKAKKLINAFWPGPLTIVFKKSKIVPDIVTAGLDSVAIRMPNNSLALELIKQSGCPIDAPSANSSGKPSPTNSEHVLEDLNGKIDGLIIGESSEIGLESTVLDMTSISPAILRPGKITKEDIEKIIGKISSRNKEEKPKSPGMKYKHYSPNARVIILKNQDELKKLIKENRDKKITILSYKNEIEMAKNLFKDFRNADKQKYDIILVQEVEEKGLGTAIMNRLKKAAGKE